MPDKIDQFIALPKGERDTLFSQLSPAAQHKLLAEVSRRRSAQKESIPSQPGLTPKGTRGGFPIYQGKPKGAGRQHFGMDDVAPYAPDILGAAGGALGSLATPAVGVLGAAAGGALGTHIARSSAGQSKDYLSDALGGGRQALYDVGGRVAGKVLGRFAKPAIERYPKFFKSIGLESRFGPKSVGHLTAAASEKRNAGIAKTAISSAVDDIEQEMMRMPEKQRTVEGFLNAVTRRREALHNEYGNALGPVANRPVDTTKIVQNIRGLMKDWMAVKGEGQVERAEINRAMLRFQKPRTVGQLDSLRQQLNTDLASVSSKAPNARYTALHGNINMAIDNAIAEGAREILYPIADRASGKPAGYFARVLDKERNLITLRGILQKRFEDLSGAEAISRSAGPLSPENVNVYERAGGFPRVVVRGGKNMFAPPRELEAASRHVRKAVAVKSAPYHVLFSGAARVNHARSLPKSHPLAESQPAMVSTGSADGNEETEDEQ